MIRTILTFTLAAATLAAAPRAAQRDNRQEARIRQGVTTGALTGPEARRLHARENAIERSIVRDRIDGGVFTPKERIAAEQRQDSLSRDVFLQKHDRQRR
ncbi:MAG: hypothetical protein MUC42_06485 [Bryobacter sp.]|jgi:hypothetical protein|nr:hypothetical protein [Bryobacter sp.]